MDEPLCSIAPLLSVRRTDRGRGLAARRGRRPWRIAVLVSVGFHLLLVGLLLFLVRSRPVDLAADPVGAVELLMVEKQGSGPATAPSQPASQTPASATATNSAAPPPAPPSRTETPSQAAPAAPAPPTDSDEAGEPIAPAAQASREEPKSAETPAPEPTAPQQEVVAPSPEAAKPAAASPTQPAPPPQREAPVFNLEGTDSESNAIVMGEHVIPASPDDRFRNRPPVYPYEAAVRGEHGAVLLVIHVSEYGASAGADVVVTSGIASLDRAALDAVRKWRFRPAMKDGRTVPFDMKMRFIFDSG